LKFIQDKARLEAELNMTRYALQQALSNGPKKPAAQEGKLDYAKN
jgi:hypothetical protein